VPDFGTPEVAGRATTVARSFRRVIIQQRPFRRPPTDLADAGSRSRGHGGQLLAVGDTVERDQRVANEIEGPSDLAVPQTPANPIDDFNEIRTRLAIVRGDVRPAFGRLINIVNPHRKVEPVKYMMSRARTGRFAERARTFRPIAENRDRSDGCRAQFMKNAAQLILLGNSLCGHAAENDLLPVAICDLGEQDLERAHLIMTNRSDMAPSMESAIDFVSTEVGSATFADVAASFSSLAPTGIVRWRAVSTESMSSCRRAARTPTAVSGHGGTAAKLPSSRQPARIPVCTGRA
jgi:hypothetical protein